MNTQKFFSFKWIIATLLVIAAVLIMVRLGIWQLDRLKQRVAINTRISAMANAPAMDLNQALTETLASQLPAMQYRHVEVTGQYDFSQQVGWKNQVWGDELGVHLLTPLHIAGSSESVLVDRGWIPLQDFDSNNLSKYDISNTVTITGYIQTSQFRPWFWKISDPAPAPGQPLASFYIADVNRISAQIPYPLLPVIIMQLPTSNIQSAPPYRNNLVLDLSNGPHLGYALEWFFFAGALSVIYVVLLKREREKYIKQKIVTS